MVTEDTNTQPKILFLDIETAPATAYVWKLFDVIVTLDQIIDPGGILCFAAKWYGDKETMFFSEWEDGRPAMLAAAHKLLMEADAIVTYNGDKFDLPKLNMEFLVAGMKSPGPLTSIDVYKTARKLGFLSRKLDFIAQMLRIGEKVKHEGFALWSKVMAGDVKARKRMKKYNKGDVTLLEGVYKKMLPFIDTHPHLGSTSSDACGACGSKSLQKRGFRRTRCFRIQRVQCNDCGGWSQTTRTKVK